MQIGSGMRCWVAALALLGLGCMDAALAGESCSFTDPSTKRTYDFSALKGRDYVAGDEVQDNEFRFYIHVCGTLMRQDGDAQNYGAGVWQEHKDGSLFPNCVTETDRTNGRKGTGCNCGAASTARFAAADSMVELHYFHGDKCHESHGNVERSSVISFTCDEEVGLGNPALMYEGADNCTYFFSWPTAIVCPNGYTGTTGGIGGGSIFVIICLVLLTVYCVAGVVYKRLVRGNRGIEQIPNVDTWRSLGALVADGFRCICRRNQETVRYTGLSSSDDDAALMGGYDEDDDDDERLMDLP